MLLEAEIKLTHVRTACRMATYLEREATAMARGTRLKRAAVRIGKAVGRADRTAHKVARAAKLATEEIGELKKKVEALSRDLKKSSDRLRRALS
jgi:hypothetical protein